LFDDASEKDGRQAMVKFPFGWPKGDDSREGLDRSGISKVFTMDMM
jgi:hypothetical protein